MKTSSSELTLSEWKVRKLNCAPSRDGDRTLDPLFDKLVKHFEEKLAAEKDKGYRLDN